MIEDVFAALPIGREKAIARIALAARLQISEWKVREVLAVLVSEGRVALARESRPAEGFRYVYFRDEWLPVETMPVGRPVLVKTTTGRERLAKRLDYARVKHRYRGASISCLSIEPRGDVTAVGWRDGEK